MSTTLPIVRDTRRRDYLATTGQVAFGLDVPVFDLLDVAVFSQPNGAPAGAWTKIPAAGNWSVAYDGGSSDVIVTFLVAPKPAGGSPAVWIRVESARVQDRTTDATRGGVMNSALVERDFDTIATVLQEVRRDIDDATNYGFLANAQAAAVASQNSANASANSATASAGSATASQVSAVNSSNSANASAASATASQGFASNSSNSANASAASAVSSQSNATAASASASAAAASAVAADVEKMVWRNAWATAQAYAVNDVVFSGGSSYICTVAHTSSGANTPPNASFWDTVAQKGDPGSGGAGSGDVIGPVSAVVGHWATFSNVDGKHIGDGGAPSAVAISGQYNDLLGKPTLSTVAGSGQYNDLLGKPTLFNGAYASLTAIPAAIDAIDGLAPANNKVILFTGASTAGLIDATATGQALLAAANAAAVRATASAEQLGFLANVVTYTANQVAQASDLGCAVEMDVASANTYTINTGLGSTKARFDLVQKGAGQTTIVAGAGVTIRNKNGLKLSGQWSAASFYQRATDEWVVFGDLTP